jgi:hypothetical protein
MRYAREIGQREVQRLQRAQPLDALRRAGDLDSGPYISCAQDYISYLSNFMID